MRRSSPSIRLASPSPFITTLAPAAAICSRMPRPMPLVDPVTSAMRPVSGRTLLIGLAVAAAAECCASNMLALHRAFAHLVDEDTAQRIDLALPRLLIDHAPHVVVAGLPA